MKKWQERLLAVFATLGLSDQVKANKISAEDYKKATAEYEKTYGISFADDKKANEDVETMLTAEEITELAGIMAVEETAVPKNAKEAAKTAAQAVATAKAGEEKATKEVVAAKATIEKLAGEAEETEAKVVQPIAEGAKTVMVGVLGQAPHSATHLFGIADEKMARGRWFNELTATRKPVAENITEAQRNDFNAAFSGYTTAVRERLEFLNANNLIGALDFGKLVRGEGNIDYSQLFNTAGEYIVRRTDLILAYFRSLPSVGNIFPVVSNVQNKELAPTANFGSLSQGYRVGRVFKGNVKFAAEVYSVTDLMFKYNFANLIELEKQYIGYMNREGSNVIKWTFIEWILVNFGTILISEQNVRRVCGVRVPQQNVTANPANFGADGVLRAIERVEEDLKVLPFEEFGAYGSSSILDTAEGMWDKFVESVPVADGYKLFMNARHKRWYIRAYRSKYGADADFAGANAQLVDLAPDNIVWVPNMPLNCFKMWITLPGNVENLEDKPGEMTAFIYTPEFEGVVVMSRWKEGAHVQQPGVKYSTLAELKASNFKNQFLFTNFPATELTLAASLDLSANTLFEITGTTAVTSVTGVSEDQVIKLVASAAGVVVNKSGVFSTISETFTAGASGDYIKVYPQLVDEVITVDGESVTVTKPTGKFLELARKVTV